MGTRRLLHEPSTWTYLPNTRESMYMSKKVKKLNPGTTKKHFRHISLTCNPHHTEVAACIGVPIQRLPPRSAAEPTSTGIASYRCLNRLPSALDDTGRRRTVVLPAVRRCDHTVGLLHYRTRIFPKFSTLDRLFGSQSCRLSVRPFAQPRRVGRFDQTAWRRQRGIWDE